LHPQSPRSAAATALSIASVACVAALLYLTRLGDVPVYVMHDEAQGALQAQAIATTGRDLSGRLLPLYFTEPEFPPGRDPLLIYFSALVFQLVPFSDAGARAPTAGIAVLNVVLMFVLARRLFNSTAMGLVTACLLMLTPVHFIRGRLNLSPLYTIPFILVWLWMILRFVSGPTTRRLAAAAITLGVACYSYLAAVVMMPLYLLGTLAIGLRRLGAPAALKAGIAFAVTLIPMVIWYLTHPERNQQIVSAYQLDATTRSPLARWIGLYWSFFDPSFLFVTGDTSLMNSTRTAGFFPIAFALLLPIGVIALVRAKGPVQLAIVGGLVTAPLVSIISGAVEMNRIMFAIPFGVLTAAYGAHTLLQTRDVLTRGVAVLLLASVPLQFVSFYANYIGDYRTASASWFAGSAREAVRAAMAEASDVPGPVYISSNIEWVHRIWRFYAIADNRFDMIARAKFVAAPPPETEAGSLFLCPAAAAECQPSSSWQLAESASSIDGARRFNILRRAAVAAVR
jgi:4-amino-4-deoxy-L-arabinose transferase-like glycosyltransferase